MSNYEVNKGTLTLIDLVSFYNGGCCLPEALDTASRRMEKKQGGWRDLQLEQSIQIQNELLDKLHKAEARVKELEAKNRELLDRLHLDCDGCMRNYDDNYCNGGDINVGSIERRDKGESIRI